MTTEEKLEHFQESTMENARSNSASMLEEYENALEQIFQEHKKEKRRQAKLEIELEKESIKKENNIRLAQEQMQIRMELTREYNELKEKIFIEVKDLLENFMSSLEYEQYLIRKIRDAKEFSKEAHLTIYIDPADANRKMSLEAATGIELCVSSYSFWGGIRAIIEERNILIDNSFITKAEEVRETFKFHGGMFHE